MKNDTLHFQGTEAAARFLERRGYRILDRSWCCDLGEVDIIALDGDCLVFVEVEARMGEDRDLPEKAVGRKIRQRYERMVMEYLSQTEGQDFQVRFDKIRLNILGTDRALIRHHINALGPAAAEEQDSEVAQLEARLGHVEAELRKLQAAALGECGSYIQELISNALDALYCSAA